jgi:hypothetical protein
MQLGTRPRRGKSGLASRLAWFKRLLRGPDELGEGMGRSPLVGDHLECSPCESGWLRRLGTRCRYGGAAVALASVTWIIPEITITDSILFDQDLVHQQKFP